MEGYSNLLWVLAAATLEVARASPANVLPWVSALCGVILLWRVHGVLRTRLSLPLHWASLATASLAASPAMGVWGTSGLATMPLALLVFVLAEAWVFEDQGALWVPSALVAVAITLLRTEGIGWVCVVAAAAVVAKRNHPRARAHLLTVAYSLLPALGVAVAHSAWRLHHYGTPWPHIALTKVGFGPRTWLRGAKYVVLFWLTCILPFVGMLPATLLTSSHTGQRAQWQAITLLALAFPGFAIAVGGDFMPFGRLLVPGLPFVALLFGGGGTYLEHRVRSSPWVVAGAVGLLLAQALPAADVHLVPTSLRRTMHLRLSDKTFLSEANRWANQRENSEGFTRRGQALAAIAGPHDAVVAAAVGAVGYHSGIEVLDQHGLVTAEVAYRPAPPGPLTRSPGHDKHVPPEFFVKYEPRFLYARAVQGVLSAGRMKDTLDQWRVDPRVMDRYVPDFYEINLPHETKRTFLFVVRRLAPGEVPAKIWNQFPERRRALNAELRAHAHE